MRIGIDIGNVLVSGNASSDQDTTLSKDSLTPPIEGAFEAVQSLVKHSGGNVWLVSKCYESMQKKTWSWLHAQNFFEKTGVPPWRVHFCHEREWKAPIAEDLRLTHFIDDREECLTPMIWKVPFLFQFGVDRTTNKGLLALPNWTFVHRVTNAVPK